MYHIALKNNSVSIWECSITEAAEEEGWSADSGISPEDFICSCGFSVIPVASMEEAENIATSYNGDQKHKVRARAWEILRENGLGEEAKKTPDLYVM